MRGILLSFVLLLPLSLAPLNAHADATRDEARAQALFTEVRCVACQGQDIADSEAAIAADMRRDIRAQIAAGRSDAQIRQSLVDHYSDYVLFRPRLSAPNLVLWGLPPLIILLGAAGFVVMAKRQAISRQYALSAAEAKKLRDILKSKP